MEKKYFSEPIDADEHLLLLEQQITKTQYQAYQTYKKNRDDELVEELLSMFENLAPWEQRRFYRYITAGKKA